MAETINGKPLVSIITIFFNAEKFIDETIESVLAQTYDNWELLLVDDGSTDGSSKIAKDYAARYTEKVRYLEHEGRQNKGMSASRNLGISKAKGDYIAFLDADDVFLPRKLERQLEILISQPEASMVCGPSQYWYSWTGDSRDMQSDTRRELVGTYNTLFKPPALFTLFLQNKARTPATCSFLAKRWLFEITGGFEESFSGVCEDQAFFAKVFLKVPVFVTGECWERYRQHPDSSCSVAIKAGQYHPELPNSASLVFLTWLKEYLLQQGINDPKVWKPLRKKLWLYHHPTLFRLLSHPLRLTRKIWSALY
jgi:glycosyltransferase involved in cell wall biosynthesis